MNYKQTLIKIRYETIVTIANSNITALVRYSKKNFNGAAATSQTRG